MRKIFLRYYKTFAKNANTQNQCYTKTKFAKREQYSCFSGVILQKKRKDIPFFLE